MKQALVIGAGPAGLMAANELALAGMSVTIADAMPSAGRKFLMAGKSGLNLTKNEPLNTFLRQLGPSKTLQKAVTDFGPEAVQSWAQGLGQEVFTGTSGRVFPTVMKASPLLRAWLKQLGDLGVSLKTRWRWCGWEAGKICFDTPEGKTYLSPDVTVLALGGASWPRLGSNGAWVDILAAKGVEITPLKAANAGIKIDWSNHMERHFGSPVKAVRVLTGNKGVRGEFVISKRGLEGSAIYTVSGAVRDGANLALDLCPDWDLKEVTARLSRPPGKVSLSNYLRKKLRLDPARLALLQEFGRPMPKGAQLAALIKKLPVKHAGLRPLEEAISTAGGVAFAAVNQDLMLTEIPGVFIAGEMLDWEAPTGGYLITASLATGRHVGKSAAAWVSSV